MDHHGHGHGHDHGHDHTDPGRSQCCVREELAMKRYQQVSAELAKTDPVRRAIQARNILQSPSEIIAGQKGHSHACGHGCSHEHDGRVERGAEDDDESDLEAELERMQLERMQLERMQQKVQPRAGGDSEQKKKENKQAEAQTAVIVRHVEEQDMMAELKKAGAAAVVVYLAEAAKCSEKSQDTMSSYLAQIAQMHQDRSQVQFWRVPVHPGRDMSQWSRHGVLMQLMVPVLPALICVRNSRVLGRAVAPGAKGFNNVFPNFDKNNDSVRAWLARYGMLGASALEQERRKKGFVGRSTDIIKEQEQAAK